MHPRTGIRKAIYSAILGQTSASHRVHNTRSTAISADDLPAVIVRTNREEMDSGGGVNQMRTVEAEVTLYAKNTDRDALTDDIDQLCGEVEAAVTNDLTLGGKCKFLEYGAADIDIDSQSADNIATASLLFRVLYRTDSAGNLID